MHCVVSMSKTLYPLVQLRKNPDMAEFFFDWSVKHQYKKVFRVKHLKFRIL